MVDFVSDYLKWLKEEMDQIQIGEDLYEITTPFLDHHNDYIQLYILELGDDQYRISDNGNTLLDLHLSGVNLNTKKRSQLLTSTLQRLGVKKEGNEIYVIAPSSSRVPSAKHRILQAILAVNDMFYLSSQQVSSFFSEDVLQFFHEKQIYYSVNPTFIGKSTLISTFDFSLQRNQSHPERLLKLMGSPSNSNLVKSIIFSWVDIRPQREAGTQLLVIINDQSSVDTKITTSLEEYDIVPLLWSERNDYISQLM